MTSFVRFVNVSPGETAVITLNNSPRGTLPYLASTDYIPVPAGTQELFVQLTGMETASFSDFFYTEPGRDYTVLIYRSAAGNYRIVTYPDDNLCCKAPRLRFINSVNLGAPGVNLLVNGLPLFTNIQLFETGTPQFVPVGTRSFLFRVTNSIGTTLVPDTQVTFQKKTIYTLILVPAPVTPGQFQLLVLTSPCHKKRCHA